VKTLNLIKGFVFLVGGISIMYFNEYLARKQRELDRRGMKGKNLFRPFGRTRLLEAVFITTGLLLLLRYFLKEFELL
jgi:hypothetical protein